ncbi:MAG: TonB-dependent receptor [Gemmatimonadales bacterium]
MFETYRSTVLPSYRLTIPPSYHPTVRAATAALLLLASSAAAQAPAPADTARLDPLVVTADRVPTPASEVTTSVTVLDGDALRARGVRHVADALAEVPGLAVVRSGSYGGNTAVFLRGGESDYLKVLIDGVPVNEPGGVVDLANLTTDNVARIEVVRGPGSVLYGSDAMTGVVQIFTRHGTRPLAVRAGAALGGYGTRRWRGGLEGRAGVFDVALSWSDARTDGLYPFNSEHRNTVWSGAVTALPDARTMARLVLRAVSAEHHYPTDGSGAVVDANQVATGERVVGSLAVTRTLASWLDTRLLLGLNDRDGGIDDDPDDAADTLGFYAFHSEQSATRQNAELQLDARLAGTGLVTVGVQAERQREVSSSVSTSQFGVSESALDQRRRTLGYYARARAAPLRALWITAGARVDDNDVFGTFLSYQAGAGFLTPLGLTLRASLGRGFKEPTVFEQFAETPFARGNPDLAPERTDSWEIAVEGGAFDDRLHASVAYFAQRFRDLIQFTFAPPDPTGPSYFNVARAAARGLEVSLEGRPKARVHVTLGYTYLHTEVLDAGLDEGPGAYFVAGEALLRRPRHGASLHATAAVLPRADVSAALRYVGERQDRDFSAFPAERITLPAYWVVELGGRAVVLRVPDGPTVTATARVENALDREYEEVFGFPAPGRRMLVGIDVVW